MITVSRAFMDDQELIEQFQNGSFPFQEWNHRAHLKAAYLLLIQYPFDEAMHRMRLGLHRLIHANHVPETPSSGYHETITRAWMILVDAAIQEKGTALNADHFLERHPQLGNKRILRLFYSQDQILSLEAKERFVEPDLAPLPCRCRTRSDDGPLVACDAESSFSFEEQDGHRPC